MTRSAQIVNTSNWDGEDLEVIYIADGRPNREVLKPGDATFLPTYGPENSSLTVVAIPRTSKTPEPFTDDDGKQVTPKLTVEFS